MDPSEQTFVPPSHGYSPWNLTSVGPVVSEGKMFENVDRRQTTDNDIWLCWGLTTRQPLRVILCRLPEKGRKEIEERVEEMKERDREERGTGKKVKKQKK